MPSSVPIIPRAVFQARPLDSGAELKKRSSGASNSNVEAPDVVTTKQIEIGPTGNVNIQNTEHKAEDFTRAVNDIVNGTYPSVSYTEEGYPYNNISDVSSDYKRAWREPELTSADAALYLLDNLRFDNGVPVVAPIDNSFDSLKDNSRLFRRYARDAFEEARSQWSERQERKSTEPIPSGSFLRYITDYSDPTLLDTAFDEGNSDFSTRVLKNYYDFLPASERSKFSHSFNGSAINQWMASNPAALEAVFHLDLAKRKPPADATPEQLAEFNRAQRYAALEFLETLSPELLLSFKNAALHGNESFILGGKSMAASPRPGSSMVSVTQHIPRAIAFYRANGGGTLEDSYRRIYSDVSKTASAFEAPTSLVVTDENGVSSKVSCSRSERIKDIYSKYQINDIDPFIVVGDFISSALARGGAPANLLAYLSSNGGTSEATIDNLLASPQFWDIFFHVTEDPRFAESLKTASADFSAPEEIAIVKNFVDAVNAQNAHTPPVPGDKNSSFKAVEPDFDSLSFGDKLRRLVGEAFVRPNPKVVSAAADRPFTLNFNEQLLPSAHRFAPRWAINDDGTISVVPTEYSFHTSSVPLVKNVDLSNNPSSPNIKPNYISVQNRDFGRGFLGKSYQPVLSYLDYARDLYLSRGDTARAAAFDNLSKFIVENFDIVPKDGATSTGLPSLRPLEGSPEAAARKFILGQVLAPYLPGIVLPESFYESGDADVFDF